MAYTSKFTGVEIDEGIENARREATTTQNGLMSATDKTTLDSSVTSTIDKSLTILNKQVGLNINTAEPGNVIFEVTDGGLKATVNGISYTAIEVDALPPTGADNIYYLLPTETVGVYEINIWALKGSEYGFLSLGRTEINLSDYVRIDSFNTRVETYIAANYTALDMLVEYTDGTSETFKVLTQNP